MKNRRNIVVAFLLCACLIVGVGFATLTEDLTATGSAKVGTTAADAAFEEDISFQSAAVGTAVPAPTATTGDLANTVSCTEGEDTATFYVGSLKGAGDYATFTFTIQNKGDVAAKITEINITNNTLNYNFFEVTTDLSSSNENIAAAVGDTAGVTTITVRVELKTTPTEDIEGSFEVKFTVETVGDNTTA